MKQSVKKSLDIINSIMSEKTKKNYWIDLEGLNDLTINFISDDENFEAYLEVNFDYNYDECNGDYNNPPSLESSYILINVYLMGSYGTQTLFEKLSCQLSKDIFDKIEGMFEEKHYEKYKDQ